MKKPTLAQAILMLVVALIVTVSFASWHKKDVEWNTFTYVISDGETLWTIAEEYCPEDMDYCEYIYKVKKLNKMEKSNIAAGQTITLLTTEEDLIDMYDVVDIQENDGWYTITLADGNYYEWSKGELK